MFILKNSNEWKKLLEEVKSLKLQVDKINSEKKDLEIHIKEMYILIKKLNEKMSYDSYNQNGSTG
jgi:c-di-GMP-related signal transduction protein